MRRTILATRRAAAALLTGAAFSAALLTSAASPAAAAGKRVCGTIRSFECGDDCNRIIRARAGEAVCGPCAAPGCAPRNGNAAMPDAMVGRRVEAVVGAGGRYDGAGNAMGEMDSFDTPTLST